MTSFIGNNVRPNGAGLIPPRKVISGRYRSIIGNGSGLFSPSVLSFDLATYTNTSPRYIGYNGSLTGPFGSGVLATRTIGGNLYALVEKAATTLSSYSEDLNSLYGTKYGITIGSNVVNSPLGTLTADKLLEDTSTGLHGGRVPMSVTINQVYVCNAFYKAAERSYASWSFDAGIASTKACFNLNTGAITYTGTAPVWSNSRSLANGWWKFTFAITAISTVTQACYMPIHTDGTFTNSYTGTLNSGMYIWGVNIINSNYQQSYIYAGGSPATKAKDILIAPLSKRPTWLKGSKGTPFSFNIIPNYSNTQLAADTGKKYLFSIPGTENVECYLDGSDRKVKLDINSVNKFTSTVKTWSAQANPRITIIPNNGLVSKFDLSGFTTGNGVEDGAIFSLQDIGNLSIGSRHTTDDLQLDGLISEFRRGTI